MALTSQLDAVNIMLSYIGEAPVNSIDTNSTLPVQASTALTVLNEISRQVQSGQWHFNHTLETLQPDSNGTIFVPATAIAVDAEDSTINVVVRGAAEGSTQRRLFNLTTNSFTFEEPVKCFIQHDLAWDDLPENVRYYIAIRASKVYQARTIGSAEIERLIARDEHDAKARVMESDSLRGEFNIFDNYDTATIIGINRPQTIL